MKALRTTIISIFAFALCASSLKAQNFPGVQNSLPMDFAVMPEEGLYASIGYNVPLGAVVNFGYAFDSYITAFGQLTMADTWSRESKRKFGLGASVALPIEGSRFSPYLEAGMGSEGIEMKSKSADGPVTLNGPAVSDETDESSYFYVALGTRWFMTPDVYLFGNLAYSSTSTSQIPVSGSASCTTDCDHIGLSFGVAVTGI